MVTFDEIEPDEQILATGEFGFLHDSGGFTNGKLILTQRRLVFVIGGGLFGSKQRTAHAIDLNLIDNVVLEPAQTLGINLRVDFTSFGGPATIRYNGRMNDAKKITEIISQSIDYGLR
ncbi:MAG: hypothetical protein ACFFDQ_09380 [Candidatus Thorarchaeota archaeon]